MSSLPIESPAPAVESPPAAPSRFKMAHWVLVAALLAVALKVAWATNSIGSDDILSFYKFARVLDRTGLCVLYTIDPHFNHTPLTGGLLMILSRLSGGEAFTFATLLRLVGIVADLAVVLGLLRWRKALADQPPWWSLLLFALSPVSIMISGFHGNVDPIMTAAMFFAALAAVRGRPAWCGLLFGLACNIKIVPMVFGPVFFFYWLHRRQPWRFAFAAGAVLLAGSALPLWYVPEAYLRNVFGYGSYWGMWGVPYLLRKAGIADAQSIGFYDLNHWQTTIMTGLKLAIIFGILALAWVKRRTAPIHFPALLGVAWLLFFVFAPGAGVQYMVWLAPFVLLLDSRAYLAITAAATGYLFVFYDSCADSRWPWFLAGANSPDQVEISGWWGLIVWLIFVGLLVRFVLWPKVADTSGAPTMVAVPPDIL